MRISAAQTTSTDAAVASGLSVPSFAFRLKNHRRMGEMERPEKRSPSEKRTPGAVIASGSGQNLILFYLFASALKVPASFLLCSRVA